MHLTLSRHSYHPVCTMGWLHVGDTRLATLEPPWRQNRKNMSCVPEGTYELNHYNSLKFQNCFELQNVPDRRSILIHIGNRVEDTEGCILVGMMPSPSALMVLQSANAMARLRELLAGSDHMITIDFERGT